jgi:hypothetical protein
MIVCTSKDPEFNLYKNIIKDKKVKFTINQIFSDWWLDFLDAFPNLFIRNVVYQNISRMLACKTKELGCTVFKCSDCNKELFVYHTCKSRICSSCGNKYNEQRTNSIMSKLFRYKHRHVVFTIPEDLRRYFKEDRKRLNLLFDAASITIKYWVFDKYKKHNLTPAFISVLHTFGRDLKFNPHIHIILLDGGISNNRFIKIHFFSYASFRKRFMKVILDMLEDEIGKKEFRKLKNDLYFRYKEGFYVYAPPTKYKVFFDLVKYVCRYVARPPMAESRIINYDGKYVTFWYQERKTKEIVIEKIHAFEFISRVIIHIPDRHFKQIRFYGAYNNATKIKIDIANIIPKEKLDYINSLTTWRIMILKNFSIDPLNCKKCNGSMVYYKYVYT